MALRWASTRVTQYARRTWVHFVERHSGKPVETVKNGRQHAESHRFEARNWNKPFESRQGEWKRRLDEIIQRQKYHENSLVARCQRLFSPTFRLTGSMLARGVPAYGLVGVALANGSGRDDDVHGYDIVCKTIRNLMAENSSFKTELEDDIIPSELGIRLTDYKVGKMIGQGCNAAVCEARLKSYAPCDEKVDDDDDDDDDGIEVIAESDEDSDTDAPNSLHVEEDGVIGDDVSSMDDVSDSEESASFEKIPSEEDDDLSFAQLNNDHQQEFNPAIKVTSNDDAAALNRSRGLTEDDDSIEVISESEEDLNVDAPNLFHVEEDLVTSEVVASSVDDLSESNEFASFEIISDEENDVLFHVEEDSVTSEVVASSVDDLSESNEFTSFEIISDEENDVLFHVEEDSVTSEVVASSVDDLSESKEFASFEIISDEENDELSDVPSLVEPNSDDEKKFDLAIKIAFNYNTESNSCQIMRSFEKEAIPAKMAPLNTVMEMRENGNRPKMKMPSIPPHPNIVDMRTVFVGEFPLLAEALTAYPMALPKRLNPDGWGNSKTLFLVMKKYETTLRNFVGSRQLSSELSCLLLLQLLEGILHMFDHGFAHRDLKSDNLLLDIKDSGGCPHLVVSDFGCCLASDDLRLPYSTDEISKGGNLALMAPEIVTASPEVGSFLDYRKADVWSAGTLAYETFGQANPFYRSADGSRLNSYSYVEEDLPLLQNAPEPVRKIVQKLLTRDQEERPDAKTAANMMQIVMWGPKRWLESIPCKKDVVSWLVVMAAEVRFKRTDILDNVKLQMKQLFLSRVDFDDVMEALYTLNAE